MDADQFWGNSDLRVSREEPRNCPYTVRDYWTVLTLLVFVHAPSQVYVGNVLKAEVFNSYGQSVSGGQGAMAYVQDAQCVETGYCAAAYGRFSAATTDPIRDSVLLESWSHRYAFLVRAWLVMTGTIGTPTAMSGTSAPPPSVSATWTTSGPGVPNGYRYQWFLNGLPLAGATQPSYTHTFSSGRHNLAVHVKYADNTIDTIVKPITVSLATGIDGPSGVRPTDACSWMAVPSGGVPPYTYTWTIDGVLDQESSNFFTRQFETGGHSIVVGVRDSVGQYAESILGVTVHRTEPMCMI